MRSWPKLFVLGVFCASACRGKSPAPPEDPSNGDTAQTLAPGTSRPTPDSSASEGPSSDATSPDPQDPALAPTWDNFGDAFLRNWCKGCHSPHLHGEARFGAPEGVDLMTLKDLRQWRARVKARATGERPSMPPAGGPTPEERQRLAQWLERISQSQP